MNQPNAISRIAAPDSPATAVAAAIALLLLVSAWAQSAPVVSAGDGNWDAAGTWIGGVPPGPGDDVVIQTGHTVALTGLTIRMLNSLWITGTLTHAANSTTEAHKIHLDIAAGLTINAGGVMTATGRGYSSQNGPGAATGRYGGAYGGMGGMGYDGSGGTVTYGSITHPVNLGSGGAGGGGSGGGAVVITAGAITNHGVISANGSAVTATGNGAGGSISLEAGTLSGDGIIAAKGGDGTHGSGGGAGGGGRVAIRLTGGGSTFSGYPVTNITAHSGYASGGWGATLGAAGTVYLKMGDQTVGDLIVDNAMQEAPVARTTLIRTMTNHFASITVTNWGVLVLGEGSVLNMTGCGVRSSSATNSLTSRMVIGEGSGQIFWPPVYTNTGVISVTGTNEIAFPGDLVVADGGVFTHEVGGGHRIDFTIGGNLTVDARGAIWATARGHGKSQGPGVGTDRVGGAHGGQGGSGYGGGTLGTPYGSIVNPMVAGSGGNYAASSRGGGVTCLRVAGVVAIFGTLAADGWEGGAGGSVNLWAGGIDPSSDGTITASGVKTTVGGQGSGGGGRIAVVLTNGADFGRLTLAASSCNPSGGWGSAPGAAGTIYLKDTNSFHGLVWLNNAGIVSSSRTVIPPILDPDSDPRQLYDAMIVVTNRAIMAVSTNVQIRALTVAGANEKLQLGAAATRLTLCGMPVPGTPPAPYGLAINDVVYARLGLYSTNNWNGYAPVPANVSGAGDIWLRSPDGSVLAVR